MDTSSQAKQLFETTKQFHLSLVERAREIAKIRDILEFVVECISFAESCLPATAISSWKDGPLYLTELSNRTESIFASPISILEKPFANLETTAGSSGSGAFSILVDNYRFFEDNETRTGFSNLAARYKNLLSGQEQQDHIYRFLAPLSPTAQTKFSQALKDFHTLPTDEDFEGSLLTMRSAIDEAIRSLMERTPLTKTQRGDLQRFDELPTIARYLAKDELSKVDIILANDQFMKLKMQLSASKQMGIHRQQAEALINESVAILNLIASTVKLPDKSMTSP